VRHIDELPKIVAAKNVAIGVIAVPAEAAQDAADRLVRSGVTSILTFAPIVLDVPAGIAVRPVDLASELQILSYHEQKRAASGVTAARHSAPATA
jgi:redox-sensing transcriptional repressor